MARVNVYAEGTGHRASALAGWFDSAKAECWSDADRDGNGSGGTGRGQAVWRTAQGRWVLENWSNWQGEASACAFIDPERAREWLLRNEEDEAVAKYFGPVEEERGPGRPAIGSAILVRFGGELLAMVDAYAAERGIKRAEAVRRLTTDAVTRARVNAYAPLSPQVNR